MDKHNDYNKYLPIWQKAEDCTSGEEAIKAAGQTYLPATPDQLWRVNELGQTSYDIYKKRARVFPAAGRTLNIYTGLIERLPPSIVMTDYLDEMTKYMTLEGVTKEGLTHRIVDEVIKKYRCGVLIDIPADEMIDVKPYCVFYKPELILNWEEKIYQGQKITSKVVLLEEEKQEVNVYRILYLNENMEYSIRIVEEKKSNYGKEQQNVISDTVFIIRGNTLPYIPFISITESGLNWNTNYPLINDICNLMITEYQTDADYRNALSIAGRPTPCVSGLIINEGETKKTLGTNSVWQFEPGGQWGFLGLDDASGINALKTEKDSLKMEMATIGSRSLAADPSGVEAAETARIHRSGENAVLATISKVVSRGMEEILDIIAEWIDDPQDVEYRLNTDFIPEKVDPALLAQLYQQYVTGAISYSTFFYNLKSAELIPANRTEEEEKEMARKDYEELSKRNEMQLVTLPEQTQQMDNQMQEDNDEDDQNMKTTTEVV